MAGRRVRVGMTARYRPAEPAGLGAARAPGWWLHDALTAQCRAAGGLPLALAAPLSSADDIQAEAQACIDAVDALILGGGGDIGLGPDGRPLDALHAPLPERDRFEYALLAAARSAHKPVLGICRGAQLIQLACGGTLEPPSPASDIVHVDPDRYVEHGHLIEWVANDALRGRRVWVNSAHRWRILALPAPLEAIARCPADGTIEAFRADAGSWLYGTLWHPEFMQESADNGVGSGLFSALVDAVRELQAP